MDIDAGASLVEAIKPLARATARRGAEAALGGFGALFDLRAAGYHDPLLVSTTDGVGTKVMVAIAAGKHATVGIDLVAMCVNDLVVLGAEPLFFLDYFASARLDVGAARDVIAGIADGCRLAGCALIGGETAEMPGLYRSGDYDLAGFAVGAVERDRVLTGENIVSGDVLLGLASSGLHSNGFSLARRIVEELSLDLKAPAPFATEQSLAEALLTPTRIYVASALAAARQGGVKAFAHITGGGLLENVPRVLPDGLAAEIDMDAWPMPPVFRWLANAGQVAPPEMTRTFNCGIGMVAIVSEAGAAAVTARLAEHGETVHRIGRIIERRPGTSAIALNHLESAFGSAP